MGLQEPRMALFVLFTYCNTLFTIEPTAAPTDLMSFSDTSTSLSFSWSEPPCGDRGGIITGYTYKLTQVGSMMPDNVEGLTDSSNRMVMISGLIPYTDYSFQVAANTSQGMGPLSSSLNTRTTEGGKLRKPCLTKQSNDMRPISRRKP